MNNIKRVDEMKTEANLAKKKNNERFTKKKNMQIDIK